MLVPLCSGLDCPLKEGCFRFVRSGLTGHPEYKGFTYPEFVKSPFVVNNGKTVCNEFWKIEDACKELKNESPSQE
jgi:hypothetical protein